MTLFFVLINSDTTYCLLTLDTPGFFSISILLTNSLATLKTGFVLEIQISGSLCLFVMSRYARLHLAVTVLCLEL